VFCVFQTLSVMSGCCWEGAMCMPKNNNLASRLADSGNWQVNFTWFEKSSQRISRVFVE
jgi:hypothetical protein